MKNLLGGKQARDFGRELIPNAIKDGLKVWDGAQGVALRWDICK